MKQNTKRFLLVLFIVILLNFSYFLVSTGILKPLSEESSISRTHPIVVWNKFSKISVNDADIYGLKDNTITHIDSQGQITWNVSVELVKYGVETVHSLFATEDGVWLVLCNIGRFGHLNISMLLLNKEKGYITESYTTNSEIFQDLLIDGFGYEIYSVNVIVNQKIYVYVALYGVLIRNNTETVNLPSLVIELGRKNNHFQGVYTFDDWISSNETLQILSDHLTRHFVIGVSPFGATNFEYLDVSFNETGYNIQPLPRIDSCLRSNTCVLLKDDVIVVNIDTSSEQATILGTLAIYSNKMDDSVSINLDGYGNFVSYTSYNHSVVLLGAKTTSSSPPYETTGDYFLVSIDNKNTLKASNSTILSDDVKNMNLREIGASSKIIVLRADRALLIYRNVDFNLPLYNPINGIIFNMLLMITIYLIIQFIQRFRTRDGYSELYPTPDE